MQLNPAGQKPNVLAQLHTGYAELKEAAPKVAIIDDFFGEPSGFPHGQAVESVLLSHSNLKDADIQRIQNAPEELDLNQILKDDQHGFVHAFQTMAIKNTARFYLSTAMNLHTILNEQPTVKLVTQSQGESPSHELSMIFDGLKTSDSFRGEVAKSLGLEPEATLAKVCDELLSIAETSISGNELCKQARQEFLKAAEALQNKGVNYFVAAGNEGVFQQRLLNIGADPSPSAFRNILVNEFATTVGANDAQGNPSLINSPNTSIDVYGLGEDLPWKAGDGFNQSGVSSGTSFAVPVLAGKAIEMLDANPQLEPFYLKSQLMGNDSIKVAAGESKTNGAGMLLTGDGKLESFVSEAIGDGFYTDVTGSNATELATSQKERTLFGLPGTKDSDFQFIKVTPSPQGRRQLEIETYYLEGHHTLRALEKDGVWDPSTVQEELHLDPKRKEQYANQAVASPEPQKTDAAS